MCWSSSLCQYIPTEIAHQFDGIEVQLNELEESIQRPNRPPSRRGTQRRHGLVPAGMRRQRSNHPMAPPPSAMAWMVRWPPPSPWSPWVRIPTSSASSWKNLPPPGSSRSDGCPPSGVGEEGRRRRVLPVPKRTPVVDMGEDSNCRLRYLGEKTYSCKAWNGGSNKLVEAESWRSIGDPIFPFVWRM